MNLRMKMWVVEWLNKLFVYAYNIICIHYKIVANAKYFISNTHWAYNKTIQSSTERVFWPVQSHDFPSDQLKLNTVTWKINKLEDIMQM